MFKFSYSITKFAQDFNLNWFLKVVFSKLKTKILLKIYIFLNFSTNLHNKSVTDFLSISMQDFMMSKKSITKISTFFM